MDATGAQPLKVEVIGVLEGHGAYAEAPSSVKTDKLSKGVLCL
jgi:hypothetical protein